MLQPMLLPEEVFRRVADASHVLNYRGCSQTFTGGCLRGGFLTESLTHSHHFADHYLTEQGEHVWKIFFERRQPGERTCTCFELHKKVTTTVLRYNYEARKYWVPTRQRASVAVGHVHMVDGQKLKSRYVVQVFKRRRARELYLH